MLAQQRFFTQQRPTVASRSSRVQPRTVASARGLVPLVREGGRHCRQQPAQRGAVRPQSRTECVPAAPGAGRRRGRPRAVRGPAAAAAAAAAAARGAPGGRAAVLRTRPAD
jgi:hypothetical protein